MFSLKNYSKDDDFTTLGYNSKIMAMDELLKFFNYLLKFLIESKNSIRI